MNTPPKTKNTVPKIIGIGIILTCVAIILLAFIQSRFNIFPQIIASNIPVSDERVFPEVETANLSDSQKKVVEIVKTEYSLNPKGTKYSGGIEEAWCADFVSWVFNEAGVPLSNPNSGSWRIPGTITLREYYQSVGKFRDARSGYSPKVGDSMLYDNPSPFGQHTNIVIKNEDGIVTTIGGNEPGGIRVFKHEKTEASGFIGYGVF